MSLACISAMACGVDVRTSTPICRIFCLTSGLSSSLIMLAGIYDGSQNGGSTTAILVNLPGEASSIVATLDG